MSDKTDQKEEPQREKKLVYVNLEPLSYSAPVTDEHFRILGYVLTGPERPPGLDEGAVLYDQEGRLVAVLPSPEAMDEFLKKQSSYDLMQERQRHGQARRKEQTRQKQASPKQTKAKKRTR